jgi:hypothetical protein
MMFVIAGFASPFIITKSFGDYSGIGVPSGPVVGCAEMSIEMAVSEMEVLLCH